MSNHHHSKEVGITQRSGEVNGAFGGFCNRIMQVGGTGLVLLSLPALVGVVWLNYTNTIQIIEKLTTIQQRVEDTVTIQEFKSEINRIKRETEINSKHIETVDNKVSYLLQQRGEQG
jgi:hypothetical protein